MAGEAIHFVIPVREHAVAARKARINDAPHPNHLARHVLLGIAFRSKVLLQVTVRALHAQSFIEAAHDERDIGVCREQLQVLVSRRRAGAAASRLLRDDRNGYKEPQQENPHE